MKLPFFSRKDPVVEFWAWFEENRSQIGDPSAPSMQFIKDIGSRLKQISPDLVFQLGFIGGKWTLELSAGGIMAVIPAVEKTIAAAPPISDWNVVAFRQRIAEPGAVEMHGRRLEPADIRIKAVRDGDQYNVVLFISGLTLQEKLAVPADPAVMEMAFILLDGLLGEYDVMTRLNMIDFEPFPPDGSGDQLQPFEALRGLVDGLK